MLDTSSKWFTLLCITILIWYITKKKTKETFYIIEDQPGVRNQFHLPADYRRPTNTLLTSFGAPVRDYLDTLPLPDSVQQEFTEWIDKGLLLTSKDQKSCGGCWAFATTDSLTDKYIIATNGKWMPPFGLSAQELISCSEKMGMQFTQGCSGGIPQFAFDTIKENGITLERFDPGPNSAYSYYQTGDDPNTSCQIFRSTTCPCDKVEELLEKYPINTDKIKFSIDPNSRYKTADGAHLYTSHGENEELNEVDLWPDIPQSIINKNIERMKKAIYYEGSITAGIRMTEDFYRFQPTRDNYFQYDGRSAMTGGHAICIVGWKVIDNVPVWICRNSWGENWGYGFENPKWNDPVSGKLETKYKGGFWNHRMGINDNFIESNCSGAHPDLTVPEIKKFLSSEMPMNWYTNTTLRSIHNENAGKGGVSSETEVIDQIQLVIPYNQIPSDAFTEILKNKNTKATILTRTQETSSLILNLINRMIVVNYNSVKSLAQMLSEQVNENIVLSLSGNIHVYYYLVGIPSQWNLLDLDNYIQYSTHPGIIADRVYNEMTNFVTDSQLTDSKVLILTGFSSNQPKSFGPYVYNCNCTNKICQCDGLLS